MVSIISNNRKELMGVGTLAVFSLHILLIADIPLESLRQIISVPVNWVFTEGFLFLSGFGCYFSLSKKLDYKSFYSKRIKRVYLPYLIIAGPFLTFFTFYDNDGLLIWIARILTINFWIEGNFASMWYISVTMLMYLIAPPVFRLIRDKYGYLTWGICFLLCLILIDNIQMRFSNKDFIPYQFITQIPAFFIGMLLGKLKDSNANVVNALLFSAILLTPILKAVLDALHIFSFLPAILIRLSYVVMFALLIANIKKIETSIKTVMGGGKFNIENYALSR